MIRSALPSSWTSHSIRPSVFQAHQVRHATKKAGGSSNNGRTSQPKHLGIKSGNGATVVPGTIVVRQRGTQWHAGAGIGIGRDHTLFATKPGKVMFGYDLQRQKRIVSVVDGGETSVVETGFASRAETKRRLAEAVDPEKYLGLDAVGRYEYVLGLAKGLAREEEGRQRELLGQRLAASPRRGTFGLVDLTLI
ncbi:ribosomal L27 protein-domain-containing protein [Chytriomyces sp. MP71]|nr:ribosomal L27 protein-domain-containing protein [Chytriomyces sp. MP71]